MARGAVVAVSVHAGWIGRKYRLARLTIASGFGDGIDGSYRAFHRLVFLNRLGDALSCRSNSRRETPMVVREFLEKGRDLTERIPYSVIALAARFAVADVFWRSGQTKVAGLFAKRASTFFVRSTKCPCWRRTLRHISVPPASASFRFFSFLD
jgi:hypothetical protein